MTLTYPVFVALMDLHQKDPEGVKQMIEDPQFGLAVVRRTLELRKEKANQDTPEMILLKRSLAERHEQRKQDRLALKSNTTWVFDVDLYLNRSTGVWAYNLNLAKDDFPAK